MQGLLLHFQPMEINGLISLLAKIINNKNHKTIFFVAKIFDIINMMSNKYHDLDSCEHTRGVDKLLLSYKQDQDIVTNLVINDPNTLIEKIWKHDGILAIDNACRCRLGEGDRRTHYICSQCKNIRRLKDFREEDKTFKIQ